jgi:hypothetical protein
MTMHVLQQRMSPELARSRGKALSAPMSAIGD